MQVKTFMSGISYILGELRDITEIDELRGNEEVLANLQASGVKQYAHAVESLIAMTERSAAETISKSGVKPEEVDVVVIATNAYRAAPLMLDEYKIMFYNLGLTKAYPIGVFLSNCGNLHSALRVATSIIKAEGKKHVLVITSDRVLEDESRIYPPGIAVISDGVASCMISSEADREYEILHIEQHIDNFLSQVDARTNLQQFFKLFADGVTYAISHAISHVGKNIKDFKMLITNNYNTSVSDVFAKQAGSNRAHTFTENIPRFAHAFAADNLINLADYTQKYEPKTEDLFLLLGTGLNTWAATVVKKV